MFCMLINMHIYVDIIIFNKFVQDAQSTWVNLQYLWQYRKEVSD